MPELGPATTDAELDDLLNQIDKEISLDPELSQDLLEFLDEDDEGVDGDESMDVDIVHVVPEESSSNIGAPSGYSNVPSVPDYMDEPSEFYDDTKDDLKSVDIEDDPEMAEMLKMLEHAKGDLEGAKEEELAHLMEHFDNEEMFHKKLEEHKIKKATLKRPSGADQVVPSGSVVKDDPAKKKKILSPLEAIQLAKAKKALPSPSNQSSSKTSTTTTTSSTTSSSTTIEKLNNSLKPPGYMDGIAVQPNSEEKPVSFEEDAKIDTISTPTKGRVAPPRNRRPPTRKRQNDQDQEQVNSNNCDGGTNATAENNSEEITTMPTAMSSPGNFKQFKNICATFSYPQNFYRNDEKEKET